MLPLVEEEFLPPESSALAVICFIDATHSDWGEVESQW
jgi:hypothetical protein